MGRRAMRHGPIMKRKPVDDDDDERQNINEAWSQHELNLLHDMVRDYDRARWLRGQMKWWAVWLLGVPTAGVTLWQAINELYRLSKGGH